MGGPKPAEMKRNCELFKSKCDSLRSKPALRKSRKQGILRLGVLSLLLGTRGGSIEPKGVICEQQKVSLTESTRRKVSDFQSVRLEKCFSSEHMIENLPKF